MSALFHTPLTAPRVFVGSVDATRERITPIPRTLEQAFGPAAHGGVLVAMDAEEPMHPSDRLVARISALIGAVLLVGLIAERLFS